MGKSNISKRAFKVLNLKQFNKINNVDNCGHLDLKIPNERQYILRLLIRKPFGKVELPEKYNWVRPLIDLANNYQESNNIRQPFTYLTIRSGVVNSENDDEWHVDGFSQSITHLPEQNYIWTDKLSTEYVVQKFKFPKNFNGLKHNIHNFFQKRVDNNSILKMNSKEVYAVDPYIIHRRPSMVNNTIRTFVRLSFTPIEINDINNTVNPLIETNYTRDSIKEFRNCLINYDK